MRHLLFIFSTLTVVHLLGCDVEKKIAETIGTTTTTLKEVIETSTTTTTQKARAPVAAISWEASNTARKAWSLYAYGLASGEYFLALDEAKDWKRFCNKYDSLSLEQRATLFVEWISATSKFESSWNPKSYAVDVGKPDNKATWSTGLMQVSAIDYQNKFRYTFDDLLTPNPNIHLSYEILAVQIKKTGLVILPNTSKYRYWAVLLEGNKYSKIPQIVGMTQKLPFCN